MCRLNLDKTSRENVSKIYGTRSHGRHVKSQSAVIYGTVWESMCFTEQHRSPETHIKHVCRCKYLRLAYFATAFPANFNSGRVRAYQLITRSQIARPIFITERFQSATVRLLFVYFRADV